MKICRRIVFAALFVCVPSVGNAKDDVEAMINKTLAQEFILMSRPLNDFERQFMKSKEFGDNMTGGLLGEKYMKDEGRVPIEFVRALDSLRMLSKAANLCDQENEDELRDMVNERAIIRGDHLMMLGFDKTVGLFFRESLMRHAIEYYRIGEAQQKQSYAQNQRAILGEEVERAEGERRVALEEYQERLQPMIENIKNSKEDELKTDAQKREFNDEADALEDALDL